MKIIDGAKLLQVCEVNANNSYKKILITQILSNFQTLMSKFKILDDGLVINKISKSMVTNKL